MDYKSFIEAARLRQQEEDARRQQRQAAARSQRSSSAPAAENDGRSIVDRIGDAIGGAGRFAKESVIDPFVDNVKYAGTGVGRLVDDATGTTARRDEEFEKSQDEWQQMLLKQIQKSRDEALSPEERAQAGKSAESISRNMNQEFQSRQAELGQAIEDTDPIKQAGAITSLATTVIPPLKGAAPVATAVGGQIAKATGKQLASNAAKNIGIDAGTGIIGGVADAAADKGSDATAKDFITSAGIGAALGGTLSAGGQLANSDVRKSLIGSIGRNTAKNAPGTAIGAPKASTVDSFGREVPAARTQETAPSTIAPDAPDPNSIDGRLAQTPQPESRFFNKEQRLKDTQPKSTPLQKIEESLLDRQARLKTIGSEYSKATGETLQEADNPYALKRLELGADDAAEERLKPYTETLSRMKDEGISDAVREYGVAKQIVTDRAGDYPPELVQEMQGNLARLQETLSPEELSLVEDSAQAIVDFNDSNLRRLVDNGAMSEDWYNNVKNNNSYYFSPFKFEEYVNGNQRGFSRTNSSNNAGNIVRDRKGLDDADRFSIEDPFTAVANQTVTTENFLARNRTLNAYRKLADVDIDSGPVILTDAEGINKKIDLQVENKEMRPVRERLDKTVKTYGKDARRLETAINNLEKQGLQLSLRDGGDRMTQGRITPAGLGGEVPTSQAGQVPTQATDDAGDLVNQLDGALKKTTNAAENYGGITQAERDARMKLFNKSADVSDGLRQDVIAEGAGTRAETNPSMLGPQDTQTFLNNLIENGSRADIDRIKSKIPKMDQRLHNLLDEIGLAKSEYDEVAGKIRSNNSEVEDIVKNGKDVPAGYEVLESWEDGRRVRVAAPQVIADAFKGKNDIQTGAVEKFLAPSSKMFKEFATILSPAFTAVDSLRNFQTWVNTSDRLSKTEKALVVPAAIKWARGVLDATFDTDIAKTVRLAGGGGANTLARGQGELSKHIADNLGGIKSTKNMFEQAADIVGAPYRAYKGAAVNMNRNLEYGAKLAEARMALEGNESVEAAALAARNAAGDMQAAGTVGRLLSNYVPFTNSIIQGNKRVFDYAKKSPGTFATTVAATVAMPTIAGYAWNRTMYPEVFDNISEYERENNFVLILGDDKDENGRYTQVMKIPKNEIAKMFGNPLESTLAAVNEKEPLSIKELLLKSVGYATPLSIERDGEASVGAAVNSTLTALPVVKAGVQLATNKNMFTGQDITPENLQGLNPEDQVKTSTKGIDKVLSAATGGAVNPLEAESLRSTFTAGAFSQDPVTATTKRFVGASGSRGTNEFYATRNEVADSKKRASLAINRAIEAGDEEAAARIAELHNSRMKETFQPWIEKYGAESDDSLRDEYKSLKINLDARSKKQRRNSIREKQEKEAQRTQ